MKRTMLVATTAVISALPVSWAEQSVTICHFPPGNRSNVQIITIGSGAARHHVTNHAGDGIYGSFSDGACGLSSPIEEPE